MEPKFQTSFIPKSPIGAGESRSVPSIHSSNIFSIISTMAFLAVVIVSGGLFFYKNLLSKQIAEADVNLIAARAAFEPDKIQELINVSSRILSTKTLLEKHVVVSEALILLQKLTVRRINFTGLTYENKDNKPTISIEGGAESFNAIAQQQNIFSKNDFVKNIEFSDFDLDENGNIKMNLFAELYPQLVSYKELLTEASSIPVMPVIISQ